MMSGLKKKHQALKSTRNLKEAPKPTMQRERIHSVVQVVLAGESSSHSLQHHHHHRPIAKRVNSTQRIRLAVGGDIEHLDWNKSGRSVSSSSSSKKPAGPVDDEYSKTFTLQRLETAGSQQATALCDASTHSSSRHHHRRGPSNSHPASSTSRQRRSGHSSIAEKVEHARQQSRHHPHSPPLMRDESLDVGR